MYHLLTLVVQPLFLLFLVTGLALANLWRKRRETRRRLAWVTVPFLLLGLLSTPPVSHVAVGTLEWSYPPEEVVPEDAGAIVVLAGNVRPRDTVRTRAELGADTLSRCLHALALHRRAPDLPLLVSGGLPDGGPNDEPFATAMRDFLVEMGVPPGRIWTEEQSRTTHENAVQCARILRERGVTRIILVTEADHMRRAAGCFRKQNLDVAPSACNHTATEFHLEIRDFFPSAKEAYRVERAAHEWLGIGYYWLRGRL